MLWDPPWGVGEASVPQGGRAEGEGLVPKGLGGGTPGTVAPASPHPALLRRPVQELPPPDRAPRVHLQRGGRLPGMARGAARPPAAPLRPRRRLKPSPGLLLCLRLPRPALPRASLLIPGSRRREPGSHGGEPWRQPGRFQSRIAVLRGYLEPPGTSPCLVGGQPSSPLAPRAAPAWERR